MSFCIRYQMKNVTTLVKNVSLISSRSFHRPIGQLQRKSTSLIIRRFSTSQYKNGNGLSNRFVTSFALAVGIATISVGTSSLYIDSNNEIMMDSSPNNDDTVEVDRSVNPFPIKMISPYNNQTQFSLIGSGIRKVTFLKFRVYALGIYIAEEDIPKVAKVFDSPYLASTFVDIYDKNLSHQANLKIALNNPKTSDILINNLLEADVRFLIRIAPLKDTDFNHLRDGFVKSAVRNNYIKSEYPEELSEGITLMREVFKNNIKKSKCPKNHLFFVETDKEGRPTFTYQDLGKTPDLANVKETIVLGTVENSVVSKAFLLNYFAAKNPIAQDARDKAIDELVRLV